jgi:hypothetical protein
MLCNTSLRKPHRPLPAARWHRRLPPAVRCRTTCQFPRRPRDRYSVTNVTDIHLCRTSSSGNRGRFPGLAGPRAARPSEPAPARSPVCQVASSACNRTDRKTYLGMRLIPLAGTPDRNSCARVRQRTSNGSLTTRRGTHCARRSPAGAVFAPNWSDRDIAFLGQVVINCGILARRRKGYGWQSA